MLPALWTHRPVCSQHHCRGRRILIQLLRSVCGPGASGHSGSVCDHTHASLIPADILRRVAVVAVRFGAAGIAVCGLHRRQGLRHQQLFAQGRPAPCGPAHICAASRPANSFAFDAMRLRNLPWFLSIALRTPCILAPHE
eukprot:133203-Amphidinium_carterae.1